VALDQLAHDRFTGTVGLRHRVENAAARFVLGRERRPEERQDGLPRKRRKLMDKARKVDQAHARLQECAIGIVTSIQHAGEASTIASMSW
jgi:hypothetical protein